MKFNVMYFSLFFGIAMMSTGVLLSKQRLDYKFVLLGVFFIILTVLFMAVHQFEEWNYD